MGNDMYFKGIITIMIHYRSLIVKKIFFSKKTTWRAYHGFMEKLTISE